MANLALDSSQPGIARATALDLLRTYGGASLAVVERALLDRDPLVRFGAVRASEAIPAEQRYRIVYRMLEDSTKLVRTEAARALASVPRELMPQSPLLEMDEALTELRRATEANPLNTRFAYVYGMALQSTGQVGPAITVLEQSLAEHPYDLAILTALVTFNREAGDLDEALRYAGMWVTMAPDDSRAVQELADLMRRGGR